MKFKPFVIGSLVVLFLIFYLALRTPDCPIASDAVIADAYQQQVPQKKQSLFNSQPFTVYAITPTYARPVQKAELTRYVKNKLPLHNERWFWYFVLIFRLAQTLLLVPFVHWIIVEDDEKNSDLVRNLLDKKGLSHRSTLLFAKTPSDFKLKRKDPSWSKPRGVAQRNEALKWIRNNVVYTPKSRSAIYFMDDDNTYSTELFEEIKKIESGKVAVWPVGLVGGLLVEKPVLDDNHRVLGFNSAVGCICFFWILRLSFKNASMWLYFIYSGVPSDRFQLIWPVLAFRPTSCSNIPTQCLATMLSEAIKKVKYSDMLVCLIQYFLL